MVVDPAAVTAADIARLAGVTRGAVSNWRRRHADFPAPIGGTDASPAFDRAQVEQWLADRDALPEASPDDLLWRAVAEAATDGSLDEVLAWTADRLAELTLEGPVRSLAADTPGYAEIHRILTSELGDRDPAEALDALLDRYASSVGIPSTPQPVAELMADLADARGGDVFDPAAGTGELISVSVERRKFGQARGWGQELNTALARMADARVWLHVEDEDGAVVAGDSLRHDEFPNLRVHTVLCHPPFGVRDWGLDELADDPRWEYGIPPRLEPELAWVQHALAHLEADGKAALLMPPAAASRPSGRRIRAELLRRGALRGVLSLPAGAVQPRHVPVHLWVLQAPGSQRETDPRVLLVEGAGAVTGTEGSAEPKPGWTEFDEMARAAWDAFGAGVAAGTGEPGRWQVLRAIDLLDETVDLTPARHVGIADSGSSPARTLDDVRALASRLRDALRAADASVGDTTGVQPGNGTPSWRTATVSDLARQGTLEFYRWPGKGRAGDMAESFSVRPGDVLVPAAAGGQVIGTVVGAQGEQPRTGQFHVIRPDPVHLDPWCLAGFLTAPASVQQASYGTGITQRIDARRLAVPILPLAQQRRYGEIFKRLHDLAVAITEARELADDLTTLLARALADGTVQPAGNGVEAP
ncbi:MAG TPA: N-6 DNA methylase [Trebonia sp.]